MEALLEQRNTPAHAGKTLLLLHVANDRRKHPRACGEAGIRMGLHFHVKETPTRMRGRQELRLKIAEYQGNTPAHAGKTCHR